MTRIYDNNSLSIGNTPLVKLNRIAAGSAATIVAKIEGRNPAYSVKCRIGAAMIWDAEKRGILTPGSEEVTALDRPGWTCIRPARSWAELDGTHAARTTTDNTRTIDRTFDLPIP